MILVLIIFIISTIFMFYFKNSNNKRIVKIEELLYDKIKGLEIGGPSKCVNFIYNLKINLDGLNHKSNIWQGEIKSKIYKNNGIQYFGDALNLPTEIGNNYDFIIASHVLEHIANPLKALFHWKSKLENEGLLILILPKKELCFDHKRPITPIKVLIDKYNKNIGEDDLSSLEEILEFHDLSRDKAAGSFDDFKKRSLDNFNNRCLHHHVFDIDLLEKISDFIKMKVIFKYINGIDQWIIYKKIINEN